MYICKDCGQTFTDPYYLGKDCNAGNEPIFACPFCHMMRYTEAVWCNVCETWKDPESTTIHEGICYDCITRYYNAYVGVHWLTKSEPRLHEFMRWQWIPLVLDDDFADALKKIRTEKWGEKDRESILRQIKEYFFLDLDWLSSLLHSAINGYDYGHFASHFSARKFLRFLGNDWDRSFPVWEWFAAYFYGLDKTDDVMVKSLFMYLKTQMDAADNGGITAQTEVTRCTKIMTDFVREFPYVGIAYCIYCEEY